MRKTYQYAFLSSPSEELERQNNRVRVGRRAIENASYTLCDRGECVAIEVKIQTMEANECTPIFSFRFPSSSRFDADICPMVMFSLPFITKEVQKRKVFYTFFLHYEAKRQRAWLCLEAHEDCQWAVLKNSDSLPNFCY